MLRWRLQFVASVAGRSVEETPVALRMREQEIRRMNQNLFMGHQTCHAPRDRIVPDAVGLREASSSALVIIRILI